MSFDIFQTIEKILNDSLELSLINAETYDMSEGKAVDTGLQNFFLKVA